MHRRLLLAVATCTLGAHVAHAQPAPAPDDQTAKADAQSLVGQGMKQYASKDYAGALTIFTEAYKKYASPKILLDIATTLAKLERPADAANTYQRYLDAPDNDPARRAGVVKALAELDKKLAIVAVATTPPDAEVRIADGDWIPATGTKNYRVVPGAVVITARHDGYVNGSRTIHVDEGGELDTSLVLAPVPPPPIVKRPPPPPPASPQRSRLGAIALAHIAVEHPGVAGLVGVEFDALPWLQLEATALIGKTSGGYAAIAVAPWPGRYRPFAVVGAPLFVSNGARVSLRGGLGFELVLTQRVSLLAEVAVEHALNPEADIDSNVLVPALGVTGRL
jgi:hypothetical protein